MIPLDDLSPAIEQTRRWLGEKRPQLAIVLGSGLADFISQLVDPIRLYYLQISGFPQPGVSGHAGRLHCGMLAGQSVLVFEGRYHVYEGYSAWQVTAPVRLAAALGCKKILLTNAVGGLGEGMQAGDFMLVSDHLNFTGQNPLLGRPEANFIDLGNLYQTGVFEQLREGSKGLKINLHCGVLAWMLGPNYETPAEIRALRRLGADAVTMSTVPEAIVSRLLGTECMTISLVANLAAGINEKKLDHQDILKSGQQTAGKFATLINLLLPLWI